MTRHITMNVTRERKFDEKWERPTPFPEGKQKAILKKIQLDEEVQNFKGKPSFITSKFKLTFQNEAGNTCTGKVTASLNDKSKLYKIIESILTISGRDFEGMDKNLEQFSNWLNALIGCEFVIVVKNNLYKEVTYSNTNDIKPLPKVEYPNPETYKDCKNEFEFPGFKPKPSDNKTMSQSEVDSATQTLAQETGFEGYPDSEAKTVQDDDDIPF